ncbi:hypothetical protein K488DRAFT_62410 [Vararia minispora EC-137]|uniref:Uncharacterized protein n=1 Tax=Vararia minispora EC-137 TaxID=1314806 RepID=A0ACB8Q5X7_9AGAM|nr:hypothetical protein K488DRAFT_62410 [Vararia minispora EC-137]
MVWADTSMNQAKSNVVNNNRQTAAQPPQQDTMDFIRDTAVFGNRYDDQEIWEIEYFIRSFAALGTYFGRTSSIFQNTASQMQNLLSEITPDSVFNPTQSLPALFYEWLLETVQAYPNGCMSRTTNAFNYYRMAMSTVAAREGLTNGPPACTYQLYWAVVTNPDEFLQALLPAQPTTPSCHVPGSQGQIQYVSGGNLVWTDPASYFVLGSGNIVRISASLLPTG